MLTLESILSRIPVEVVEVGRRFARPIVIPAYEVWKGRIDQDGWPTRDGAASEEDG